VIHLKKILTDLDVLTVALWDEKKEAMEFLQRIKSGEFDLYTPYVLLEVVGKWKHEKLRDAIIEFYTIHSSRILSVKEIVERSKEMGVYYDEVLRELMSKGVKEEDAILVFAASTFHLDYLVTYNRVHLRGKETVINEILEFNGMKAIRIVAPTTI